MMRCKGVYRYEMNLNGLESLETGDTCIHVTEGCRKAGRTKIGCFLMKFREWFKVMPE